MMDTSHDRTASLSGNFQVMCLLQVCKHFKYYRLQLLRLLFFSITNAL